MMKRNKLFTGVLACLMASSFMSCELLQGSLSSTLNSKLEEETGVASLAEKIWYYNGTSSTDMSATAKELGDEYFDQTILINFSKKVALNSFGGEIVLTYTDENDVQVTKTFTNLKGSFTDDFMGYKISMTDVVKLLDTKTIPSGTASMKLKVSGFVCAEGSQAGRTVSTLEVRGIKIMPLYKENFVDFSTVGFDSNSEIEFELNGKTYLEREEYIVSGTGTDSKIYCFKVSASGSTVNLKPDSGFNFTDLTALKDSLDSVSVPLTLKGISTATNGNSYTKDISVNFSKYAIIINGKKDKNFLAEKGATVTEDASADVSAFEKTYPSYKDTISKTADIQEVSINSDDKYLYIGVSGNLCMTWNEGLAILISNGKVTGGDGARAAILGSDAVAFAKKTGTRTVVQPNVYMFHQPGYEDSGAGSISAYAYVSSANTNIASSVKYSPEGWTQATTGDFIEYAIPLGSVSGINAGDTVSVIAAISLVWDEGKAVSDVCPDAAASFVDADHTGTVTYDFNSGISYTIPTAE